MAGWRVFRTVMSSGKALYFLWETRCISFAMEFFNLWYNPYGWIAFWCILTTIELCPFVQILRGLLILKWQSVMPSLDVMHRLNIVSSCIRDVLACIAVPPSWKLKQNQIYNRVLFLHNITSTRLRNHPTFFCFRKVMLTRIQTLLLAKY